MPLSLVGWQRNRAPKRELLSLAGSLTFAAKVVPPGRTFCHRLFDSASSMTHMDARVPIPSEVKQDVMWWESCISQWNGRSLLIPPTWLTAEDLSLYSDASGSQGFGLVFGTHWAYGTWSELEEHQTIEWKELFAAPLACMTWGNELANRRILLYCDNEAVCHVWRSGVSRNPRVMDLVRAGLLWAAQLNIVLLTRHISGHHNDLADSWSRLQVNCFRALHPAADAEPTTAARYVLARLMKAPWHSSVAAWQTVRQQPTHQPGGHTSSLPDSGTVTPTP